jgi:hypothetical protein
MKAELTSRNRFRIYWLCQALGWGAYFVVCIIASQSYAPITWRTVEFYLCLSCAGLLLTHGFRSFVRQRGWTKLPLGGLLVRIVPANLLMALVLVAVGFAIGSVLKPLRMHRPTTASVFAGATFFVVNDFMVLAFWSVAYFGFGWFEREQRAEVERYQSQTALAEAELRGLKRQLNPHFLFNALNSLRALITEDPARARAAVTQLAGILRYHLTSGERSFVRLEEEVATVGHYLALELIRFDDRLSVTTKMDERSKECLLPTLSIQTLVENAIKYGPTQSASMVHIALSAAVNEQRLVVVVGNTGTLDREGVAVSTGLGLANLRTRLALLFGEEASLELAQIAEGWVEARLTLPVRQDMADRAT